MCLPAKPTMNKDHRQKIKPGGQSAAAINKIMQGKNDRLASKAKLAFFLSISFAAAAYVGYKANFPLGILAGMVVFAFILFFVSMSFAASSGRSWYTPTEYYSIAGSRFENGEHRCIHCGHKGIWRKGRYRTSNVYSFCSKCRKPLYAQ